MEDTVKGPGVSTLTSAARVSLKLCESIKVPADAGVRLTTVAAVDGMHAENSDVLPPASVAVDVIPAAAAGPTTEKLKDTFPLASVVTLVEPRKVAPSPYPLALQDRLEKNSIMNAAPGALFSVPLIVVVPLTSCSDVMTGKL